MKSLEVQLPPLHPSQAEVFYDKSRFKVLPCGRRYGKTVLGTVVAMQGGLLGGRWWWVAPTYSIAGIGFRGLAELAEQIPGAVIHRGAMVIEWPTGGVTEVRSAHIPGRCRGEGLNGVVIDESAFVQSEIWYNELRPALSDRKGNAYLMGTPHGLNWYHTEYVRGVNSEDGYRSWQLPTSANPFMDQSEIDAAKKVLPDRAFRQEYMAEFIEDGAGVFTNIKQLAVASILQRPISPYQKYVIGWDPAKIEDYSQAYVMDRVHGTVVDHLRMNQIEYLIQCERIAALSKKWNNAPVCVDITNNATILEVLRTKRVSAEGFQFTMQEKQQLIEGLAVDMEQKAITYPNYAELIGELQVFRHEVSRAGNLKYAAPEGFHDDCVIALALANYARKSARFASFEMLRPKNEESRLAY